jgi:hypothetical protein
MLAKCPMPPKQEGFHICVASCQVAATIKCGMSRSIRLPGGRVCPAPPSARGFLLPTGSLAWQARSWRACNSKHPALDFMTIISINAKAFAGIETAFPGDWRADIRPDGKGAYLLTLPDGAIDLLTAIRGPEDSPDHGTAFASTLSGLMLDCNWQVGGRPIGRARRSCLS